MNTPLARIRLGMPVRGALVGALLLAAVAVPAFSPQASAAGCGTCDDDGDGLVNADELAYGTALDNPDTDGDGLFDGWEISVGLSPLSLDSDGNGLSDYEEMSQDDGSDPGSGDVDGDGLTDGYEGQVSLTDQLNPDTDGDGLSDGVEIHTTGTDPLRADSEGDGMLDVCDPDPWIWNTDNESGSPGSLFGGAMGCSSIS